MKTRSQETEVGRQKAPALPATATGWHRLGLVFYRIGAGSCRIATASCRIIGQSNRLLPHIAASCRIMFFWRPSGARIHRAEAQSQPSFARKLWRARRSLETIWGSSGGWICVKLCGKSADCYALLRESSRCFTKVRTDQARNSAIVRIFTGETLFSETGDF
jgi:hypothetical protein